MLGLKLTHVSKRGPRSIISRKCDVFVWLMMWLASHPDLAWGKAIHLWRKLWLICTVHCVKWFISKQYMPDEVLGPGTWINWPWKQATWWRHCMEILSTFLALCEGNPFTGQWRNPLTKGQCCGVSIFFLSALIVCWGSSRVAGYCMRYNTQVTKFQCTENLWQARTVPTILWVKLKQW